MQSKIILFIFTLLLSMPAFAEDVVIGEILSADTIKLADGRKVKMIGVDPEGANRAKQIMKGLEGKPALLEFDKVTLDDQGNILGYIIVSSEHFIDALPSSALTDRNNMTYWFLNIFLVVEGFTNYKESPGNSQYKELFEYCIKEAQAEERGIWKRKGAKEEPYPPF